MPALKGELLEELDKIQKQLTEPLWKGPTSGDANGGITQSMLNLFLVCRERFRVKYVLGLQPKDDFHHRLEYGSMWHACEEGLAAGDDDPWERLDLYVAELCEKYPLKQKDIFHWYEICKLQFPIYVDYWKDHPDVLSREPVSQEETFNIFYRVASDRIVRMRGKFDSIDIIDNKLWLQENKTKGDINLTLMQRNLTFDKQTMFYLTAMSKQYAGEIGGVRYNVIRRPLSGGKGSIRQKKNQSEAEYYEELAGVIKSAIGPEWKMPPEESFFFMRWKVGMSDSDIAGFMYQFLDPIFEQLLDWWEYMEACDFDPWSNEGIALNKGIHYRSPYGVYSPLYDGKPTDMDEYLASGSQVGLHRAERLFRELV